MLPLPQHGGLLLEFSTAPLREDHGIPLAIMGVLVVFLALSLVAAFIKVLPLLISSLGEVAPVATTTAETPGVDDLSEETLAVIAAAVAETIRRPQRIVRIRGITPGEHDWSLEGRLQHHQSHRLPRSEHR